MTQEEILEYNKRCAEFLGWKEQTDPTERWLGSFRDTNGIIHHNNIKEKLQFHSDWNWIMEVVEVIEKAGNDIMFDEDLCNSFDIGRSSIKFYFSPNNEYLLQLELKQFLPDEPWVHTMYKHHIIKEFDFKSKGRKAAVVQAINQFLIWYNKQAI